MVSNLKLSEIVKLLLQFVAVCESATQADVNHHLELGKQFLAKGQLSDALSHYHEAVGKSLTLDRLFHTFSYRSVGFQREIPTTT